MRSHSGVLGLRTLTCEFWRECNLAHSRGHVSVLTAHPLAPVVWVWIGGGAPCTTVAERLRWPASIVTGMWAVPNSLLVVVTASSSYGWWHPEPLLTTSARARGPGNAGSFDDMPSAASPTLIQQFSSPGPPQLLIPFSSLGPTWQFLPRRGFHFQAFPTSHSQLVSWAALLQLS